jgi:rhamnulokinase
VAGPGLAVSIQQVVEQAATLGPTQAAFDVTAPELVTTEDVLGTIRELCAGTAPSTPAEVARCVLQSPVLTYRRTVALCEQLTGGPVEAVHMIGCGTRNALLCRLTADACARPLHVGPAEGTSLGNVAVQAVAVADLPAEDAHATLTRSADVHTLDPTDDTPYWQMLDAAVPRPWSATRRPHPTSPISCTSRGRWASPGDGS